MAVLKFPGHIHNPVTACKVSEEQDLRAIRNQIIERVRIEFGPGGLLEIELYVGIIDRR